MPKVDFYILTDNERLPYACRLLEKAYKNRHRIYVHTETKIEAHQLDELLWTYRDDSFLPHNLLGEGPHTPPPIQIGFDQTPTQHHDILINLHPEVPLFFTQFKRILEIVGHEPLCQQAARERYRFYQSERCDMTTHKLTTVES